ncbi:MAG: helix-turn-helix domain-containing protein [Candidatus Levybacteria bacterium]|nr:helix-turn-helix domain-containing protein [Candidatus Levybacteria bacterium]
MDNHIEEASYPLSFRSHDAESLGRYIKNRNSVVLVGMKRVGISNFLRFFLHKNGVKDKYIDDNKNHLFIPIDLNDLVERELYPFWVLTLKRIEDAVVSSTVNDKTKKYIETLFLDSIQSQDLFLTIDSIRKSLGRLVEEGVTPTIFFLRFDRIKDVVTPEFFANLQGLIDACHQNLSYVFTSVRSLEFLSPAVFTKASVSAFARTMYMPPSTKEDARVIFDELCKKYNLSFSDSEALQVLSIVDGYTQYLQFALSYMHEKKSIALSKKLSDELYTDERIALQSEELWESLTEDEKEVLLKVIRGKVISSDEKEKASYLWNTGILGDKVFSQLFEQYVSQKGDVPKDHIKHELSKKENLLLKILDENRGALCEREHIIEYVWPEAESYGVSDWAVDRLVARLRNKLKASNSNFEIVTVKTRGYKLA